MSDSSATHYGLDQELQVIEHGSVQLAAALDVTRGVYGRQRTSYEIGEEALVDTVFGFSRAKNDFIELCVNGRDNISVTVELPIRTGRGIFKTGFRHERTARSLGEVEEWVHRYFTLSHEDLRVALSGSGVV